LKTLKTNLQITQRQKYKRKVVKAHLNILDFKFSKVTSQLSVIKGLVNKQKKSERKRENEKK